MRCRVLIGDDHPVVCEGLRRILDRPGFEIVGAVRDGRALVEAAARVNPDVIVAEIALPILNGIEAARQIRKNNRTAKILFLTMHADLSFAVEAMNAGGSGYLLKTSAGEEVITAIQQALHGRVYVAPPLAGPLNRALQNKGLRRPGACLTQRQREVLQLLAEGRAGKEVAGVLNLSVRTVEFHKHRIMERLGIHTNAELSRYAAKTGIVA